MGQFNSTILHHHGILFYFQQEHENLRQKIDEIVESSEPPCNDDICKNLVQAEANFQSYKQISTDAINNLKGQIEYINTVSLHRIGTIADSLYNFSTKNLSQI